MYVCIYGETIFTQNQPNLCNLVIQSLVVDIFNEWRIVLWYSFLNSLSETLETGPPTYPAIGFISFPLVGGSFCPGLKTRFIY